MNFWETKLYLCFGVHKLRLIKNLTPLRASPMRKRVRVLKSKCMMLIVLWRLVYSPREHCLQFNLNIVTTEVFSIPGVLQNFALNV
jgi:hypothetical protein